MITFRYIGLCQFGIAHVDIPLGDLDSSGVVDGINNVVVPDSQIYLYGTTELFPGVTDSDGNIIKNSAHRYTECSSKGYCDRITGKCQCYLGYEGSSCQRASCPMDSNSNICSGHGICRSVSQLADIDNGNIYLLWDQHMTMGCLCDSGYSGPSCNLRDCKFGFDPIYFNTGSTARYSNWSYVIFTTSEIATISGSYTITLFDVHGESWTTLPIDFGDTCQKIIRTIENLPNNAFPRGTVRCLMWESYNLIHPNDEPIAQAVLGRYGIKYTLSFPRNPGKLSIPTISFYSYDSRVTISSSDYNPVEYFIYANGFKGENIDHFSTKCPNVDVTLTSSGTFDTIGGLTPFELRIFQQCLGGVDLISNRFDATGSVLGKSYNWDYGTRFNPHVIKLVDTTQSASTDLCTGASEGPGNVRGAQGSENILCEDDRPAGFYVVFFYDPPSKKFKIFHRPSTYYSPNTNFAVYTTSGVLQMVSDSALIYTDPNRPYSRTIYSINASYIPGYIGNVDCESNGPLGNGAFDCLEKGSSVMFFDSGLNKNAYSSNPVYLNFYEISKISIQQRQSMASDGTFFNVPRPEIVLDTPITSSWSQSGMNQARAYIFYPPTDPVGSYEYALQCSGRGDCYQSLGLCLCNTGYGGDDCSTLDVNSQ